MSRIRTTKQAMECRAVAVERIRYRPRVRIDFLWIRELMPDGYICDNCGGRITVTAKTAQTIRRLARDHKKMCEQ
jgi:hypothetical protein